jgi:hypothetical protein
MTVRNIANDASYGLLKTGRTDDAIRFNEAQESTENAIHRETKESL